MRSALAHAGKSGRSVVSVFIEDSAEAAICILSNPLMVPQTPVVQYVDKRLDGAAVRDRP